jgi:phosphatidylglycerophosphate synthase
MAKGNACSMNQMNAARRPIRARDTRWAAHVAAWLARVGVRPNIISVASALFAGGAGLCLVLTGKTTGNFQPWLFLTAAGLIQMRLLCNLFDGMVAIEGGFKTKSGEIFNELPDRFADAFIFVGAGYAAVGLDWAPAAGWLCAVLAVLTAYVRALGASAGASQHSLCACSLACRRGGLERTLWIASASILQIIRALSMPQCCGLRCRLASVKGPARLPLKITGLRARSDGGLRAISFEHC